jgi:outer membrane protein
MRRGFFFVFLCAWLAPSMLAAQPAAADPGSAWTFRTRAIMTGVSDSSDPAGYKWYSAFGMEADLTRTIGRTLALGWTIGTQSREVDLFDGGGGKENLGAVEVLPVTMVLQYRPALRGRFRPYVGAGLQLTVFWEKSGALDSTDIGPEIGPTVQLGFDYEISPRVVFNAEFRAARLTASLEGGGRPAATIALHPSTLGAGVGFRF